VSVKEVILQTIALVLLGFGTGVGELMFLGAPPEIVFLREDALYAEIPDLGVEESSAVDAALSFSKAANYPTVTKYCVDNK